jgi:hypothetical protein
MTPNANRSLNEATKSPRKGEAASKAEEAVRQTPGRVAAHEKRAIGAGTSREEDA